MAYMPIGKTTTHMPGQYRGHPRDLSRAKVIAVSTGTRQVATTQSAIATPVISGRPAATAAEPASRRIRAAAKTLIAAAPIATQYGARDSWGPGRAIVSRVTTRADVAR
jgi:hypothetical protein